VCVLDVCQSENGLRGLFLPFRCGESCVALTCWCIIRPGGKFVHSFRRELRCADLSVHQSSRQRVDSWLHQRSDLERKRSDLRIWPGRCEVAFEGAAPAKCCSALMRDKSPAPGPICFVLLRFFKNMCEVRVLTCGHLNIALDVVIMI
jgi:hypothetical protein